MSKLRNWWLKIFDGLLKVKQAIWAGLAMLLLGGLGIGILTLLAYLVIGSLVQSEEKIRNACLLLGGLFTMTALGPGAFLINTIQDDLQERRALLSRIVCWYRRNRNNPIICSYAHRLVFHHYSLNKSVWIVRMQSYPIAFDCKGTQVFYA